MALNSYRRLHRAEDPKMIKFLLSGSYQILGPRPTDYPTVSRLDEPDSTVNHRHRVNTLYSRSHLSQCLLLAVGLFHSMHAAEPLRLGFTTTINI